MNRSVCRLRIVFALPLLCVSLRAHGVVSATGDDHDRTRVGHNITVGPEEEVSDATCFGCSVRVQGHVSGDVTTFGGSIEVEDQGQISGDATTFGGVVRLQREARVGGDVTVFAGRMHRDATATVGGDVATFGGPGWIVPIFAAPFVILGLFAMLIIWVVRRLRRRSAPATA